MLDLFPIELIQRWERPPLSGPLPCLTCPPIEALEILTLGGIVREMVDTMPELTSNKAGKPDEAKLANCLVKGAQQGVKALLESQSKSIESTGVLLNELEKSAKQFPSSKEFIYPHGKDDAKPKTPGTRKRSAVTV